jgi:3-oxoacyl-[acyl-carrier protein] reductase
MKCDLKGQTALITGAGRGIGRATALKLAECGADIVLVGRDKKELSETESAIKNAYKVRTLTIISDITKDGSAEKTFETALKEYVRIDILINNAGIISDKLAVRMNDKEWLNVIDTDLNAQFFYAREALKQMMKWGYGRIINVSSIIGKIGNPGQANYSAAKAGLIGMTKTLAAEYAAKGITVNAVCPGFIKTKMTENIGKDTVQKIPVARMGEAEEVADLISFLASKEAGYITGQDVSIDGGLSSI